MGEFRSKSYGDGRMEIETYHNNGNNNTICGKPSLEQASDNNNNNNSNNGAGFQDLRSYSASYASGGGFDEIPKELKKGKSGNGKSAWCFGDPELQRKKRVASYKSYSVEGKLKRSLSKSFRWVKDKYSHLINGN